MRPVALNIAEPLSSSLIATVPAAQPLVPLVVVAWKAELVAF